MITTLDVKSLFCSSCWASETFSASTSCSACCELNDSEEMKELIEAWTGCGFIQIVNHGVDDAVMRHSLDSSNDFFHLSLPTKMMHMSKDKARRGFAPIATENFATLIGESGKPNDTVEKYRIGPILSNEEISNHANYFSHKSAGVHFFPNNWTDTPCGFEANLTNYYREMRILSSRLLALIERVVGFETGHFNSLTDKHTSILSLNYYPPLTESTLTSPFTIPNTSHDTAESHNTSTDAESGSLKDSSQRDFSGEVAHVRVAEHTDVSMFTIVAQHIVQLPDHIVTNAVADGKDIADRGGVSAVVVHHQQHHQKQQQHMQGGLEVFDVGSGSWLSVPYTEGALVVNIGDCLADWSQGYFKSSLHRVVLRSPQLSQRSSLQTTVNNHQFEISTNSNNDCQDTISHRSVQVPTERYSMAYFFTPNYDAVLDWPVDHQQQCGDVVDQYRPPADTCNVNTMNHMLPVTYDMWRKNKIKKALAMLKGK